ncbi:inositol monophosphatase family protein [Oceanobacillus caeni]|uniref:inositol monophosphatase family protein n=1 Tax=Bacillaceae TaxID=186817 RepID=UPI0011A35AD9|nr:MULTISPECIES: inositol monophosphatase family protein [Bacillaceae]MBU8791680.1 inositol monophosphatase family protein [Oceanobacillus caeni]MCR1835833.1 inositol monophosphatase family protein [Oceanobacillus caeni]
MNHEMLEEIYTNAKKWVEEAGENIRSKINNPLTIDTKSNPNDLVTTMDKETELFFVSKIKGTYPNHSIIGEEGYGDELTNLDGTVWIIDPIDGTMNFVHQKRNFAISIGIFHDGVGEIGFVYDVMNDVLYHAKRNQGAYKNDTKLEPLNKEVVLEKAIVGMNHFWLCNNLTVEVETMQKFVKHVRGTRTYGSAALDFAYLAEGITNGYLSLGLAPWDVAGGMVIAGEVGVVTTNVDGTPLDMLNKSTVVASNQALHYQIIQFIKEGRK